MQEYVLCIYTICDMYSDTPDGRLILATVEESVYKESLLLVSYGVPTKRGRVFVALKKTIGGLVYRRGFTTKMPQVEPLLWGSR